MRIKIFLSIFSLFLWISYTYSILHALDDRYYEFMLEIKSKKDVLLLKYLNDINTEKKLSKVTSQLENKDPEIVKFWELFNEKNKKSSVRKITYYPCNDPKEIDPKEICKDEKIAQFMYDQPSGWIKLDLAYKKGGKTKHGIHKRYLKDPRMQNYVQSIFIGTTNDFLRAQRNKLDEAESKIYKKERENEALKNIRELMEIYGPIPE